MIRRFSIWCTLAIMVMALSSLLAAGCGGGSSSSVKSSGSAVTTPSASYGYILLKVDQLVNVKLEQNVVAKVEGDTVSLRISPEAKSIVTRLHLDFFRQESKNDQTNDTLDFSRDFTSTNGLTEVLVDKVPVGYLYRIVAYLYLDNSNTAYGNVVFQATAATTPSATATATPVGTVTVSPSASVTPSATTTPFPVAGRKWLIINYIASDNNLITYQLNNFKAMEAVGSDDQVAITAFLDYGPIARFYLPNNSSWLNTLTWTGAKLFYLTQNSTPFVIGSQAIEDYGDKTDSGSKDTLKQVIVDSYRHYPAENICLIINDHGGAYRGACEDYQKLSLISLSDINNAIIQAESEIGQKVNVLGFDACSMGNLEVAYELKDATDYMVVSSALIGGLGWDYEGALAKGSERLASTNNKSSLALAIAALRKNSNTAQAFSTKGKVAAGTTPYDLCKLFYYANMEAETSSDKRAVLTCSVYVMSKIAGLANSVRDFAKDLSGRSDEEKQLFVESIIATTNCYSFATDDDGSGDVDCISGYIYVPTWMKDPNTGLFTFEPTQTYLFDLGYLMKVVKEKCSVSLPELSECADNVLGEIDKASPLHYGSNTGQIFSYDGHYYREDYYPEASGFSICLPTVQFGPLSYGEPWELDTLYRTLKFYEDCPDWVDTIRTLPENDSES